MNLLSQGPDSKCFRVCGQMVSSGVTQLCCCESSCRQYRGRMWLCANNPLFMDTAICILFNFYVTEYYCIFDYFSVVSKCEKTYAKNKTILAQEQSTAKEGQRYLPSQLHVQGKGTQTRSPYKTEWEWPPQRKCLTRHPPQTGGRLTHGRLTCVLGPGHHVCTELSATLPRRERWCHYGTTAEFVLKTTAAWRQRHSVGLSAPHRASKPLLRLMSLSPFPFS